MVDVEVGLDCSDPKRQKTQPSLMLAMLGPAARIESKLRGALGNNWEIKVVSFEEAANGKVDEAVALVVPPAKHVNELVTKLPQLRLLQCMAAGIELWNIETYPRALTVCNTSTMDHAIAEYVMSAMLHWQIRLIEEDRKFREDRYFVPPFRYTGCKLAPGPCHAELGGKTLGIVGYGNIGVQIAKRALAFNMQIIGLTNRPRASVPDGLSWCGTTADLPRLVRESHFVVVCCALTEQTRNLLDPAILGQMRQDAVLINVARGPVIDETALYEALVGKRIRGAVLDVWWSYPSEEEPDVLPSRHPFHTLDNVLMTPHFSGWTTEQDERKVDQVSHNIKQLELSSPCFKFVCKPSST